MVDIHCHILPGFDDGSDNFEESVRMAHIAVESGTKAIIVTPHSNIPDSYQNYCDQYYLDTFNALKERIEEEDIPLQLYAGHEIYASGDIVGTLKEKKLLTLCDSRYPLIEFPFKMKSEKVYNKLRELVAAGFTPVVAHPERYAFVVEDDMAPVRLRDMGCLLQINKGSLKGSFGRDAHMVAHSLVRNELADFVASDAHSPYTRNTYLTDAYEILCDISSVDYADLLMSINPRKVIRNEKI